MPTNTAAPPVLVVEDDVFLRLIGIVLDPATAPERLAAFADFFAHDEPDFVGWAARLRAAVPRLASADVRLVDSEDALRANLADADALVVEGLPVTAADFAAAPRLKAVQKFGL